MKTKKIEQVSSFKYLGSTVNTDNTIEEGKKEIIALGNETFIANKKIFQSKLISKNAKLKLFLSVIRPAVTCACETWILKETVTDRLMVFEKKILRKIFGPTYENGSWRIKTNQELDKIIQHKSAKAGMVWPYRKNARKRNGQSHTLRETHFREANVETKDKLGE